MSFKLFINNIRYLFRYNLKYVSTRAQNMHYALDHIAFEIEEDLKRIPKIIIKNNDETLDKLVNSECSLARFGDGEIYLTFEDSIPSQKADSRLSKKLRDVLQKADDNLMIGLFDTKVSLINSSMESKIFSREIIGKYLNKFCQFLNENKNYYSTAFTFSYINTGYQEEKIEYLNNYYKKFRSVWDNKDIVIVCGERVFKKLKYNIYDNAKSIEYIYGPTNSAFQDYDKILEKVLKKNKNKLIILILGATATVMAYDLYKHGYRALDLGHLGKDYDAFCNKKESNPHSICKFFNPE